MEFKDLELGRYYRLKVNSEIGYEDYIYTGEVNAYGGTPNERNAAFEDANRGGIVWIGNNSYGSSIFDLEPLDKWDFHYQIKAVEELERQLLANIDKLTCCRKEIHKKTREEQRLVEEQDKLRQQILAMKISILQKTEENK